MSALPRLVVILGPTASGKSALGIYLAEKLGGEILVCDSTQVYRHFDIGTAKVPAAEQHGIAHHLVDIVEPNEIFTAGDFVAARSGSGRAAQPRIPPILTAGTGLYLARAPRRARRRSAALGGNTRALAEKAEKHGAEYLHRVLARLDPKLGAHFAADTQKMIRAIELRLLTGKPMGESIAAAATRSRLRNIEIGLPPPRGALRGAFTRAPTQCSQRAGWKNPRTGRQRRSADAKPFQFIGYSQMREHLAGASAKMSRAANPASHAPLRQTPTHLVSQRNRVHWREGFGDDPKIFSAAAR